MKAISMTRTEAEEVVSFLRYEKNYPEVIIRESYWDIDRFYVRFDACRPDGDFGPAYIFSLEDLDRVQSSRRLCPWKRFGPWSLRPETGEIAPAQPSQKAS